MYLASTDCCHGFVPHKEGTDVHPFRALLPFWEQITINRNIESDFKLACSAVLIKAERADCCRALVPRKEGDRSGCTATAILGRLQIYLFLSLSTSLLQHALFYCGTLQRGRRHRERLGPPRGGRGGRDRGVMGMRVKGSVGHVVRR